MSHRARLKSALWMIPLAVAAVLYLPTPWMGALMAAVLLAGLHEWTGMAGLYTPRAKQLYLLANAALMAALAWTDNPGHHGLWLACLAGGAQLWRHPWSRMAWRRAHQAGDADPGRLYAGGTAYPLGVDDARRLAAADSIDHTLYAGLGESGRAAVVALLAAGHYRLEQEEDEA